MMIDWHRQDQQWVGAARARLCAGEIVHAGVHAIGQPFFKVAEVRRWFRRGDAARAKPKHARVRLDAVG
jgi:hypothetical protein